MPEAPVSQEPISKLLDALRAGESDAAGRLWTVYYQVICELAGTRLKKTPCRLFDQEDIALSAFKSFCVGVRAGRFPDLGDRRALWPVLIALTLRKTVDAVRHESRQKRGGGLQPISAGEHALDYAVRTLHAMSEGTHHELVVQIRDSVLRLKDNLATMGDDRLETILDLKLSGHSTGEIAKAIGCVPRTVERKLRLIEDCWEQMN
ncbi:ECF-type sigma factor [Botrimarina sp.]|uniref:ECF-type sigma factor n=1 Tax=Botrimarina sp. TaxID=2795802 RepID=UPI0032EB24C7